MLETKDNTFYDFKDKRYTTIVRMQETKNCLTGEATFKKTTYGVHDTKTETDVVIIGFHPMSYAEIKAKAIELNETQIQYPNE